MCAAGFHFDRRSIGRPSAATDRLFDIKKKTSSPVVRFVQWPASVDDRRTMEYPTTTAILSIAIFWLQVTAFAEERIGIWIQ